MLDESGQRSRSHGLRPAVLAAQVASLGATWSTRRCSWDSYEREFVDGLRELARVGTTHLVCGDVFGTGHKEWVDRVCGDAGLSAVEPLWGRSTLELARAFVDGGGRAVICAISSGALGPEWLGRSLDRASIDAFRAMGIDPGGENGEYHTVVTACSAFSRELEVTVGERVLRHGYWAADVTISARPPAHS